MANKQTEEKVFHSMEEIIKEYLPGSLPMEAVRRIYEPYNLGVLLAQTNIKDIKNLLKAQESIVQPENGI